MAKIRLNKKSSNTRMTQNRMFTNNYLMSRAALMRQLLDDSERDIDKELGYPVDISAEQYQKMYDRSDIARRVNDLYPDSCWSVDPEVWESDEQGKTEFEKAYEEMVEELQLYYYLHRLDVLSGIGRFGVMLLGLDDVKDNEGLRRPASGLNEFGFPEPEQRSEKKLLFVRPFPESLVQISRYVDNPKNPRYGMPLEYNLKFTPENSFGVGAPTQSVTVHWTRVFHAAENLGASEVFASPRMEPVYNRLLDIRKLMGGSAEMFWKGAFPGYSFEVNPDFVAQAGLENSEEGKQFKEDMRAEFYDFSNNLQRYIALLGVSAKSLAPQVANPEKHILWQIRLIAITKDCPFRIFMGSEQGSLASSQDVRNWNRKLKRRNNQYTSPKLLRPFIWRLSHLGALPVPEKLKITWPDLDVATEQDRADVADKITTALQKYETGNLGLIIAPMDYWTKIIGLSMEEAEQVVKNAEKNRTKVERRMLKMARIQAQANPKPLAGGGDNVRKGKPAGGQNPKSPSKDRSRSGGGASRTTK